MNKAVKPANQLKGTLSLPPDKSIAQRAALFSLLSETKSVISNYPEAEDPQTALKCVEILGGRVVFDKKIITVEGTGRDGMVLSGGEIDCGNSGTVMRLLAGILAGAGIQVTLTGDASLTRRPMQRIIDPLSRMGVSITPSEGGYPPLHLQPKGPIIPIRFQLPIPSAQLKSCVLLAGLFGKKPTEVVETVATRNHTETMLRLPVRSFEGKSIITSRRQHPVPSQKLEIPGDFSAAAFWMVAASMLEGSEVLLPATGINPTRCAALHILHRMGANIEVSNERKEGDEPVADLRISSAKLKATDVRLAEVPVAIDELPVIGVAMAFADGVSRIRGAEELRFKESDRLAALENILVNAGVQVEAQRDGLTIHGESERTVRAAGHESQHDHRIAMAAAILSLRGDGVSEIRNAEAAAVSYPGFWSHLDSLTH